MTKIQKSINNEISNLYIVATPIGNLKEMTPRAVEILNNVDVIACEDTRNTKKLLTHFDIKTKLIAHHAHNEKASADGLIELLKQGLNIALVSDAGYPLIQDPGLNIVDQCVEEGFSVIPVSGANAAINALVCSGLKCDPHLFYGFLSNNINEVKRELETLKLLPYTLVFYESPHRIKKTLEACLEVLGNRKVCIARELTKLHEEFIRGHLSDVINDINELKGEIVLVVDGYVAVQNLEESLILAKNEVEMLVSQGQSTSMAIKEMSKKHNVKKNDLYNFFHQVN